MMICSSCPRSAFTSQLQIRYEEEFDVLANQPWQHLAQLGNNGVEIKHCRLQHLHPCKGQKLSRQRSSSVRRLVDLLDTPLLCGALGRGVRQYVVIALDYGEQIVEVMRKAPGQLTNRFHFVLLAKLLLHLSAFRDVGEQTLRVSFFRSPCD